MQTRAQTRRAATVAVNGMQLKTISNPTYEDVLTAVRQNGMAIIYVNRRKFNVRRYPELYAEALRQTNGSLAVPAKRWNPTTAKYEMPTTLQAYMSSRPEYQTALELTLMHPVERIRAIRKLKIDRATTLLAAIKTDIAAIEARESAEPTADPVPTPEYPETRRVLEDGAKQHTIDNIVLTRWSKLLEQNMQPTETAQPESPTPATPEQQERAKATVQAANEARQRTIDRRNNEARQRVVNNLVVSAWNNTNSQRPKTE